MPSTRTIINAKDVEAATKLAEAGGPPDGKVHEWLDQSNKGLTLRLRGKKVVWICKTNSVAKLIGVAFPRDDPWKRRLHPPKRGGARAREGNPQGRPDQDRRIPRGVPCHERREAGDRGDEAKADYAKKPDAVRGAIHRRQDCGERREADQAEQPSGTSG